MPLVSWSANTRGEYWIDVSLGGNHLVVLIDSGLIDANGRVGFSIDRSLYDTFKKACGFGSHQLHTRLTADGQLSLTESGSLDAQLVCPKTRSHVGPIVSVSVFRGAAGGPNRAGLAFFHLLKGCRVMWELDQRTWNIEYP
jgi:hypothetical protein